MATEQSKFYMSPSFKTIYDIVIYNSLDNKDYIYIYLYVLFSLYPGDKHINNTSNDDICLYREDLTYMYFLKYDVESQNSYVKEMLKILKINCPEMFNMQGHLQVPEMFITKEYPIDTVTNFYLDIYTISNITSKLKLELTRYTKYSPSVDEDTTNLLGDNYAVSQLLELSTITNTEMYHANSLEYFNPNLARATFGKLIDISYFIKAFGFENKIEKILNKLSKRNLLINLIGFGGVNSNFLYWTSRIMDYYHFKKPLFQLITIYDLDTIEYSNIFRIPLLCPDLAIRKFEVTNKFKQMKSNANYNPGGTQMKYKADLALCPEVAQLTNDLKVLIKNVDTNVVYSLKNISISIGAPDYKTRQDFYNVNKHFLCPIHHNNKLFIWQNPCYKNEISIETYGKIDLQKFFMNMIRMTLVLLQKLSTIQLNKVVYDKLILQSDMDSFTMPIIDGIKYN